MTISRHRIVVEIVIEVVDDLEDPKQIAEQYARMSQTYRSIGAIESKVIEIERVL